MIEHCVSTLTERVKQKQYQVYTTDMLRLIYEGIYAYATRGKTPSDLPRWIEMVEQRTEKREERSAEDIISNIKTKLRKLGGGEDRPL